MYYLLRTNLPFTIIFIFNKIDQMKLLFNYWLNSLNHSKFIIIKVYYSLVI